MKWAKRHDLRGNTSLDMAKPPDLRPSMPTVHRIEIEQGVEAPVKSAHGASWRACVKQLFNAINHKRRRRATQLGLGIGLASDRR
jgi:hypothetical protein